MIPDDISLIDTGAAVARQLQRLLAERELLADGPAACRTVLDQRQYRTFRKYFANTVEYRWGCAKL